MQDMCKILKMCGLDLNPPFGTGMLHLFAPLEVIHSRNVCNVMGVSSEYQIKCITANFLLIELKEQYPLISSPTARSQSNLGNKGSDYNELISHVLPIIPLTRHRN